ncbi:hypothetical protein FKO01_62370 [Mesorhizobium sp. B2-3-3]|nr:hypothetical protein FKO01_62370 [Mesorhizobium sp. B2-3-3]
MQIVFSALGVLIATMIQPALAQTIDEPAGISDEPMEAALPECPFHGIAAPNFPSSWATGAMHPDVAGRGLGRMDLCPEMTIAAHLAMVETRIP